MPATRHPPNEGVLFVLGADPYRRVSVFLAGKGQRCLVVVGSQAEGFFALNFLAQLTTELGLSGWAVAQMLPATCSTGCANNVRSDAEDLDELVGILLTEYNMKEVALLGHSTGVHVVMTALENGKNRSLISRVALQGVVKDSADPLFQTENTSRLIARAAELVSRGKGGDTTELATLYDIPISAGRAAMGGCFSLQELVWMPALNGEIEKLRQHLAPVQVPLLVMVARQVEYNEKRKVEAENATVQSAVSRAASTSDVSVSFFDEVCDERRRMLNTAQAAHTAAIVFFMLEQDQVRSKREEQARLKEAEELRRSRSVLYKTSLQMQRLPLSTPGHSGA